MIEISPEQEQNNNVLWEKLSKFLEKIISFVNSEKKSVGEGSNLARELGDFFSNNWKAGNMNDVVTLIHHEIVNHCINQFVNLQLIKSLGIDENSDEIQKLIDLKIPRMQIEFLKKNYRVQ